MLVSSRNFAGLGETGHDLYTSTATSAAATARTNPPADWHSQRKKVSPSDERTGWLAGEEIRIHRKGTKVAQRAQSVQIVSFLFVAFVVIFVPLW